MTMKHKWVGYKLQDKGADHISQNASDDMQGDSQPSHSLVKVKTGKEGGHLLT